MRGDPVDQLGTLICLLNFQDKNELIYDLCLKNLTSEKKTGWGRFLDGSVKEVCLKDVAISHYE